MKTSRVIEVLKIIEGNISCDKCMYGYDSKEQCEFPTECPVKKAVSVAITITEGMFFIRKRMAQNAAKFKSLEETEKKNVCS